MEVRMMRRLLTSAALAALLASGAGCLFGKHATSLKSQAFLPSQTQPAPAAAEAAAGAPAPVSAVQNSKPTADVAATQAVPAAGNSAPAATQPAQPPLGLSSGGYMIVGTVVAEANGEPIYADKVLGKIDVALRALARKYSQDPVQFRAEARLLINQKIMEDVTNQLEFAAAERNTTDEEKQIATIVTTQYRQKEITKAGGSLAVARARSLEDGQDFDDRMNDEYQRNLIRLYYAKKVFPKVQVSADDMRRYYDMNRDRLYTERSEARFRVIRIGFNETGSKEEAFAKMQRVYKRAKAGENFGDLAEAQNDNRLWARQRGYIDVKRDEKGQMLKDEKGEPVGVILGRGSLLRLEKLEKAVFAVNVGEVTDIVDTDEGYYIAKVEAKTNGRVRPFEEEAVQAEIRDALEREQRNALRIKEQKKLWDASVTRVDDKMIDVAVEMAMQKFAVWARGA
jgi:hypothetical protein